MPGVRQGVHQVGLEAGVNTLLPGQLAVVVLKGVKGLSEVGGVVGGENRVVVRLLPTPALKRIDQAQREALNLPEGIPVGALPGLGPARSRTNCRRRLGNGKVSSASRSV